MGYDDQLREQAVRLYLEGMSFRGIGKVLRVNHQSVINWVNARAEQVPTIPPSPAEPLEVNELDELFTFVGSKKRSLRRHAGRPHQSLHCGLGGAVGAHR